MGWDREPAATEFHRVPEHLVEVYGFMNTLDERTFGGRSPEDKLTVPAALAEWLAVPRCTPADHRLALRLRRVLRAAAEANRTGELSVAAELDELGAALPLRARPAVGGLGLASGVDGPRGALAALLATVVLASADGSWARMKTCGAPDCRWVFYDHSKPRNGRWCSTLGCGNRMKTRAYRHRQETSHVDQKVR